MRKNLGWALSVGIVSIAAAIPAYAALIDNGIHLNGAWPNGIRLNGAWPNGPVGNALTTNAVTSNGSKANGMKLNSEVLDNGRPDKAIQGIAYNQVQLSLPK